jgi:hypothetical protein
MQNVSLLHLQRLHDVGHNAWLRHQITPQRQVLAEDFLLSAT